LQQSVEYMKGATWFAAPEVRETLEREFKELMARAQERQAEYENELKKLQQHRPE
jgi:Skp family chaperone for outer membrane proteins